MQVNINDYNINVFITKKKNNKNTYLRIKEDLNLYITTNLYISDKEIEKMIIDNQKSIENMLLKQINKNTFNNKFMYLGKNYDVVNINDDRIILGDNKIFVGKNIDVNVFLKNQANSLFLKRLNYWYDKFDRSIPYPKLKIRKMKSRWGVCNFKDNIVTLNLELIKRELECLDYVIVHELSHFIEPNHSRSFWMVVEANYPSYKEIRRKLKNY